MKQCDAEKQGLPQRASSLNVRVPQEMLLSLHAVQVERTIGMFEKLYESGCLAEDKQPDSLFSAGTVRKVISSCICHETRT